MAHKRNRLLIPLACLVVLGPKECAMVVPPFKLSDLRIQFISSVCQILEILTSMSTRSNGEFAMKMYNASKEAKMISKKLAMVGVNLYEGSKVTSDT